MSRRVGAANIITGTRILFSVALLFCPAFSPTFYILYGMAGLSDMIDGPTARRTRSVSEFGAKLDTVADLVFVAVCLIKLIPLLDIPLWLSVWIAIIVLIKGSNIASGYVRQKRFVAVHSAMNRITGILLFLLPLTLPIVELKYSTPLVCAAATFAAIQEGHFIRTGKEKRHPGEISEV